jgi:hypothetical protein
LTMFYAMALHHSSEAVAFGSASSLNWVDHGV